MSVRLTLTEAQQQTFDRLQREYGGIVSLDFDGTAQVRRNVRGASFYVVLVAYLPGEVRIWAIDAQGDEVLEGGAAPRE